jgi:hypothetical protein
MISHFSKFTLGSKWTSSTRFSSCLDNILVFRAYSPSLMALFIKAWNPCYSFIFRSSIFSCQYVACEFIWSSWICDIKLCWLRSSMRHVEIVFNQLQYSSILSYIFRRQLVYPSNLRLRACSKFSLKILYLCPRSISFSSLGVSHRICIILSFY